MVALPARAAAPVAVDDAWGVEDGGTLVVESLGDSGRTGVLANDDDADDDALSVSLVDAPMGELTLDPDGSFTYTHPGGGIVDRFTYEVSDGVDTDRAEVTIAPCRSGIGAIDNAGFEEGTLAGWCTEDLASPYQPIRVGSGIEDSLVAPLEPSEGDAAAFHGFDGTVGTIEVFRDVDLAGATSAIASIDVAASWDLQTYSGPDDESRTLDLVVSPAGGGAPLYTEQLVLAEIGTVDAAGPVTGVVDVASFGVDGVRIAVVATVPDDSSGPAQAMIDDLVVDSAPEVVDASASVPGDGMPGDAVATVEVESFDGDEVDLAISDGNPGGAFAIDDDGAVTLAATVDPGTYELEVTATDVTERALTGTGTLTVTVAAATIDAVVRLSGDSRYTTAVDISRDAFPDDGSAGAVVLARGDDFADGLAGTPLAHAVGGPLLLAATTSLPDVVGEEIQRVLPPGGTVHLLGQDNALGPEVVTALEGLGYVVDRIGGATRFETAVAVADRLPGATTAFVTRGFDFPDALAAGPAAIATDGVVLLSAETSPNAATTAFLAAHPGLDTYAVGGQAAAAYPDATPLVGSDRFETAVAVADAIFDGPTVVGVSRSRVFADALTGGVHVGGLGGPILLTPTAPPLAEATAGYLRANADTLSTGYAYGGTSALEAATVDAVLDAID